MENQPDRIDKGKFVNWSIEAAIQIGLVTLMLVSCFIIFKPFIVPVAWGIVIAISLFPLAKKMNIFFGGRKNLTATILTLIVLALVIIPSIVFTGSIIDGFRDMSHDFEEGKIRLTLPEDTSELSPTKQYIIQKWKEASANMEQLLVRVTPQLRKFGHFVFSTITGLGGTLIMFIISIIIAGVFLSNAKGGYHVALKLFQKLTGDRAEEMVDLSIATIRSVMQGVIGVAVIQAVLVGIGFFCCRSAGSLNFDTGCDDVGYRTSAADNCYHSCHRLCLFNGILRDRYRICHLEYFCFFE